LAAIHPDTANMSSAGICETILKRDKGARLPNGVRGKGDRRTDQQAPDKQAQDTEAVMLRREARILSYAHMFKSPQGGDLRDESGHHRYYGSSATNGGERMAETRADRYATILTILGL
jgi:hypothetical protein